MPATRLDTLFSPLRLGPVEVRNRIVSTSHQTSLVEDHVPSADLVAYHEARARGGAGLLSVEATAIHETGLLTAHTIGGYLPEVVPAYRRLSEAVHAHGARIFGQLFHGGREMITAGYRPPVVAPSPVPSARFHTEPRALTSGEIRELVGGYGTAARHAREGGLDGVECLAGFTYLPATFLSPRTNLRTDEYGGSFSRRLRFLREVLLAMRDGVGPDRAVGIRLTAEEISAEGLHTDEVLAVVAALRAESPVDYVSIAIGGSSTYRGSTWIVPPAPLGHERVAAAARRVREVAGVPVIATSRILDPEVADLIVRRGDADAVGMTRALIADPDLPRKARGGASHEIERCIGCNQACIGHYHAGTPINCTVNPWTGRERTLPRRAAAAASRRTIVVVGGGPAGCAAAHAAPRDHVVVFDSGAGLGGQWRHALAGPSHADIARALITSLERWTARADVRLGVTASTGAILAERPDLVVLATGAVAHRPPLELARGALPVLDGWDVLDGAPLPDGRVTVWDWGGDWTGLIAAEALATGGRPVTLVGGSAAFGEQVHQYQRNLYLGRLDELGVELVPHLVPVAVDRDGVSFRHVFSDREVRLGGAAALVLAAGREPRGELHEGLLAAGARVERAGDCLGARSAEEAVHEGTLAVLARP